LPLLAITQHHVHLKGILGIPNPYYFTLPIVDPTNWIDSLKPTVIEDH